MAIIEPPFTFSPKAIFKAHLAWRCLRFKIPLCSDTFPPRHWSPICNIDILRPFRKIFLLVTNMIFPSATSQQPKSHMGVSVNGGFSPHFTPQCLIIFSRKNPMGFVGEGTTILGNPHMKKNIRQARRCFGLFHRATRNWRGEDFFQWGFSMGLMDVVFFLLWLLCVFVGGKVDYMVGGKKSSYLLYCKFVKCW